jgi:hypothetical protein
VSFVDTPLGCYEETRFASREEMIRQVLAAYEPAGPPVGAGR